MSSILWVACAEPGSLYPAVPLAQELARRGHELTVLAEPGARAAFESLGLGFRPAEELAARGEGHGGYVRALYADTRRELEHGGYDVALIDPLEPGANFAAEATGVPYCSYVHWRMRETWLDTPFWFRVWDRERPGREAFLEWWNAQRALVGLGPDPRPPGDHVWYRTSPQLTLVLGLPELMTDAVLPAYAKRIGPTLWEPPLSTPTPDWLDALGRDRPAVLASVSTVGDGDRELVAGVAAAAESEGIDVILTTPKAHGLPRLPANVRVTPFPHGALLPRVSAVVSHAGNGLVTRAACAGVPLLLVPGGKDQPEVARGAAVAGIAIVLERSAVDEEAARGAIRALLGDDGYRERAHSLALRAARYDAPVTGADAIERLLAG